jgi:hypothetical protein
MDPTVVAVVGTLAGVTVTAVTAPATTLLSQRSRRTLIQEQDSSKEPRDRLRAGMCVQLGID